jgi:hypothetical protein
VLASATIITGIAALAWISGLLILAGIAVTALGIFVPHLLNLPKRQRPAQTSSPRLTG